MAWEFEAQKKRKTKGPHPQLFYLGNAITIAQHHSTGCPEATSGPQGVNVWPPGTCLTATFPLFLLLQQPLKQGSMQWQKGWGPCTAHMMVRGQRGDGLVVAAQWHASHIDYAIWQEQWQEEGGGFSLPTWQGHGDPTQ